MKEISDYNDQEFREKLLKFFQNDCCVTVGHPTDKDGASSNLIYYALSTKKQRFNFNLEGSTSEVVKMLCLEMGYMPPKEHEATLAFLDVRKQFYKDLRLPFEE